MKNITILIVLTLFGFLACANINKQNDNYARTQEIEKYKQLDGKTWNNIRLWFTIQQQVDLEVDKHNSDIAKVNYIRGFFDALFFFKSKSTLFYISVWDKWNERKLIMEIIKLTNDFYKNKDTKDTLIISFLQETLPNDVNDKLKKHTDINYGYDFEYRLLNGYSWEREIKDPIIEATILKRSSYIKGLVDTLIINIPSASYLKDIEHNKLLQIIADFYIKQENKTIPIVVFITQILPEILNNNNIDTLLKKIKLTYVSPISKIRIKYYNKPQNVQINKKADEH